MGESLEWARERRRLADRSLIDADATGRSDVVDSAVGLYWEAFAVFASVGAHVEAGEVMVEVGRAFWARRDGDRRTNLAEAARSFESAVEYQRSAGDTFAVAVTLYHLGETYCRLAAGRDDENLEKAVDALEEAAALLTTESPPHVKGAIQHSLGSCYLDIAVAREASTVESAIEVLCLANDNFRLAGRPLQEAATAEALGRAYMLQMVDDRTQNIEAARDFFAHASVLFRTLGMRHQWAVQQVNLAQVYLERRVDDRAGNVEFAIAALRAASEMFAEEGRVEDRAWAQDKLGLAFQHRVRGNRAVNLARADEALSEALRLVDPRLHRNIWVAVQCDLGNCLMASRDLCRDDQLDRAGAAFRAALDVALGEGWAEAGPDAGFASGEVVSERWAPAPNGAVVAGLRHNLAGVHLVRYERWGEDGDRDEAIGLCRLASASFAGRSMLYESLQSLLTLVRCYRLARCWDEAGEVYLCIRSTVDSLYDRSMLVSSKVAELVSAAGVAAEASYTLALAGRTVEAVEMIEWGRARLLGDHAARVSLGRLVRESLGEDHGLGNLLGELGEIESAQRREGGSPGEGGQRRIRETELLRRATLLRARFDEALNRWRDGSSGSGDPLGSLSFPQIAELVRVDIPVAYLLTVTSGSLILLVTRDADGLVEVKETWSDSLTDAVLRELVVNLSPDDRVVGGLLPGHERRQWLQRALEEALPELGAHLLGLLAERLRDRGASGVVVVACGDLGLFPLHCASYLKDGAPSRLVDEFDVAFAPSVRVVCATRSGRGGASGPPVEAGRCRWTGAPGGDESSFCGR